MNKIDKDLLLENIGDIKLKKNEDVFSFYEKVLEILENAEVIPDKDIVYCVECEFFQEKDDDYGIAICNRLKHYINAVMATVDDGYCKWGKRKDEKAD